MANRTIATAIPLLSGPLASFNGAAAQNAGPDLILRDSVVLEETEERYIGSPNALFVAADGSLLVVDGFAETVLRFNATGRLEGHWGGRGGGPGEFHNLAGVGFVTDAAAGLLDEAGKLELFSLTTGAHYGRVRVDIVYNRPSSFAVLGDSLWFAGINRRSWATYGVIPLRDVLDASRSEQQTAPLVLSRGAAPMPYRESHAFAGSLSIGFLDVGDRDVVLGFTGSPFLLRTDHGCTRTDTVWIGRELRRGELRESELLEAMRSEPPESEEGMGSWVFGFFSSVSMVRGLSRDDAGNVYTLHQDSDFDEVGTMTGVELYAAVSRFDDDRGCTDTLIPTSDVGAPIPFLWGSTLWVLDRRLSGGAASSIATVVRRFDIDPDRCTGTVR